VRDGEVRVRRVFRLHLKPWAKRKLSSITYRDVQELHGRIARPVQTKRKDGKPAKKPQGGPRAADLTVALLSHMFNKARAWGYHGGDNPARGIEKFPDAPRERWLRADEVEQFFDALAAEPSAIMRAIFTVMLLTGQRKGNVLAMRWEHVHLDRATWEIPGTETKAGNRIEVPLHEHVVALLRQREAKRAPEIPWVFPGTGKTGHVQEIKKAWRELLARAGLTDLRPHDLRHTYASWQVASGVHLRVISKALGHKSPLTVNRYADVDVEPVREAMRKAGDALLVAGGVKQPAKVLPMRKRKTARKGGGR
jgi:integrase